MQVKFRAVISFALVIGLLLSTILAANVSASPASKIIFSDCPTAGSCSANPDIDVINPNGTGTTKIGNGNSPELSPDGTRVVYGASSVTTCVSQLPGVNDRGDIYTMNADGSDVQNLTAALSCGNSTNPVWSPDGKQIVFVNVPDLVGSGSAGIYTMNADGSNVTELVAGGWAPSWSPDGTKVLYTIGGYLHTINVNGTNDQNLGTQNRAPSSAIGASWSPDGKEITYINNGSNGDWLSEVKPDGTNQTTLYTPPTGSSIWGVSWSPDGSQLALCMHEQNPYGSISLYTINADGSGVSEIYNAEPTDGCESDSWGQYATTDTTPPSLALPGTITVNATSPQGAMVNFTVTATDPDNTPSEITISCTPSSGSLFPIGTTAVNCTASDPAGNATTGSFDVVINGANTQTADLSGLLTSFNLPGGAQNSLGTKLQNVLSAINSGNTPPACGELQAFIHETNAQGNNLTTGQVDQLTSSAQQIESVLGCKA